MLSVAQAQAQITSSLRPLGPERIPLDAACGRVCAAAVHARRALPVFDNAAMDGYAVRAHDLRAAGENTPVTLSVGQKLPASAGQPLPLAPKSAARIFTGAPLPPGADAVVMQEDVESAGDQATFRAPAPAASHVRRAGEDIAVGELILRGSQDVRPGDIGMLAAQGVHWLDVHRRPRVAIVPTGSELVEIDQAPGIGEVSNSNAHVLAAQVRAAGGLPLGRPPVADDPETLTAELLAAAQGADLVVSTGGVSVGDYDLVRQVLGEQGQVDFWKVAVKPGKPLAWGRLQGVPFVGLPGNPASTFVCFELFVRPALRRLGGFGTLHRPRLQVALAQPVQPNRSRVEYVRTRLEYGSDPIVATPLPHQGSGHLSSMMGVDGLLEIPAGRETSPAGSQVTCHVLAFDFAGL